MGSNIYLRNAAPICGGAPLRTGAPLVLSLFGAMDQFIRRQRRIAELPCLVGTGDRKLRRDG